MTSTSSLQKIFVVSLIILFSCPTVQCSDKQKRIWIEQAHKNALLFIACIQGDFSKAQSLLRQGAAVNIAYHFKQTPNEPYQEGTPLYQATQYNDIKLMELLLFNKADPALGKPSTGLQSITIAALQGNEIALATLLQWKANPNARDCFGGSPLIAACENGHTKAAQQLLHAKARLDISTPLASTALTQAAQNGHTDTVDFLIKAGANVNQLRADGTTPLHHAVRNAHEEITKLLLSAGANKDAEDIKGRRPGDFALRPKMRLLLQDTSSSIHKNKDPQ